MASVEPTFGVLVFDYLKTLVPSWRLCDEAWVLAGDHLVGIGVERNYGGQLMVVPDPEGSAKPHPAWPDIEPSLEAAGYTPERVVVVIDDRDGAKNGRRSTRFPEIRWSEREQLMDHVVKDRP